VTFTQLYEQAGMVGAGLIERGVRPGDRVGVVVPTSVDFALAFFGVLAAGAVAVPLPSPPPFGSSGLHKRTTAALRQSDVSLVLTGLSNARLLEQLFDDDLRHLSALETRSAMVPETEFVENGEDDDALVQYTSGTSGDPQGVVLSHRNAVAGVDAIAGATGLTTADVGCNWLPLFHDMGLVGSFLTPALHDVDVHLQSPDDFLWDPGGWIRAIDRVGATFTMAPDSGYRYVLERAGRGLVAGLDLSSWRIAVNGAEPVDPQLISEFIEFFAGAALRRDVFLPAYGLAEATLAVTMSPPGRSTRTITVSRASLNRGVCEPLNDQCDDGRELVSVGLPVSDIAVRVVDDEDQPVPDGRTGEIQVRGTAVTVGYERDAESTHQRLRPDGWLATGDVGTVVDGELFVVGRQKETIIIFGVNHYASDLESLVRGIADMHVYGVLARQFDTGLELIVETKPVSEEETAVMTKRINSVLSTECGIRAKQITYVRRGSIGRTSSGKIRRG
jgi:acyl-CoA synthetase (AMP-forming)/AMP-acid ligase II